MHLTFLQCDIVTYTYKYILQHTLGAVDTYNFLCFPKRYPCTADWIAENSINRFIIQFTHSWIKHFWFNTHFALIDNTFFYINTFKYLLNQIQ